ncbi:MAG: response regulator transcription factor [Bacteroidetes bacterium]|nr:response regulator transcription factor [Bacteroidota bacterium]MBK8143928.1 response regulator transcription factor [Bacteroidota bacterium]
MKTKIIIVDDHTLVASTIADLIDSFDSYTVTHQLRNGKELFEKLAVTGNVPDIILLDINMPIMDGYQTMEKLQAQYPDLLVLALSMNDDEASIIKMMKLGASGYISKIIKEEELITALDSVARKGYYYTDQVAHLLASNFKQKKNIPTVHFTERELELLSYIATELTYKEIAEKMFCSPKTIDGYREDLFLKLQVKSRVGLVVYAIKNGYYKEN